MVSAVVCFVAACYEDEESADQIMVRSIQYMAKYFDLKVVAEGGLQLLNNLIFCVITTAISTGVMILPDR